MKNLTEAKAIFAGAFEVYANHIIKNIKKESLSYDGINLFFKRHIGSSSGKAGFMRAHLFLDDLRNPEINSLTKLLGKMSEYKWHTASLHIIQHCLSQVMDGRDDIKGFQSGYDWMACIHEVTHNSGVSDANLEPRLKEIFIYHHKKDAASRERETRSRECRWVSA